MGLFGTISTRMLINVTSLLIDRCSAIYVENTSILSTPSFKGCFTLRHCPRILFVLPMCSRKFRIHSRKMRQLSSKLRTRIAQLVSQGRKTILVRWRNCLYGLNQPPSRCNMTSHYHLPSCNHTRLQQFVQY
jgi:hypothetical protein